MTASRVLIVGCGDLGTRVGEALVRSGFRVYGLRRNVQGVSAAMEWVTADIERPETLDLVTALAPDFVVITTSPGGRTDERYRRVFVEGLGHVLNALKSVAPQRVFLVSSTRVMAEGDGWLDETAPVTGADFACRRLLQGERLLADSGFPCTVLRLSGLYGPGRTRLIDGVQRGERAPREPIAWTNRIHVEDAAAAIAHLVQRQQQGRVLDTLYLVTDDEPAPLRDVQDWLAVRLGLGDAPVREVMTRTPRCRRLSNARLKATGFRCRYPSYREGYGLVE